MHFKEDHIHKACDIYEIKHGGDNYNLKLIMQIIIRLQDEDRRIRLLKNYTNKEIRHHLVFGYIHQEDKSDTMPYDLIGIIETYFDLYYMAELDDTFITS